jgi:hypothetical protein
MAVISGNSVYMLPAEGEERAVTFFHLSNRVLNLRTYMPDATAARRVVLRTATAASSSAGSGAPPVSRASPRPHIAHIKRARVCCS